MSMHKLYKHCICMRINEKYNEFPFFSLVSLSKFWSVIPTQIGSYIWSFHFRSHSCYLEVDMGISCFQGEWSLKTSATASGGECFVSLCSQSVEMVVSTISRCGLGIIHHLFYLAIST